MQQLQQLAAKISEQNRNDLLKYKSKDKKNRIPLVITWHHHLRGLPAAVKETYDRITSKYPEFKKVFPEQPIVSFR